MQPKLHVTQVLLTRIASSLPSRPIASCRLYPFLPSPALPLGLCNTVMGGLDGLLVGASAFLQRSCSSSARQILVSSINGESDNVKTFQSIELIYVHSQLVGILILQCWMHVWLPWGFLAALHTRNSRMHLVSGCWDCFLQPLLFWECLL